MAAKKRDNPIRDFMPVEIDRLFSSPSFQAMKAEQRWWYMSLLLRAWQNVETPCHLSAVDTRLWMLAGASSAEHFKKHSSIVLAEFETTEDGQRLFNRKQLELYNKQLVKYQARSERASKGGAAKAEKRQQNSAPSTAQAENTPASDSSSPSNSNYQILDLDFVLDEFDGSVAFEHLCRVYTKSERSNIALTMFMEAVDWTAKTKSMKRVDAVIYIIERAKLYCAKEKFQKGLTKWLEEKIFEQNESVWSRNDDAKDELAKARRVAGDDDF